MKQIFVSQGLLVFSGNKSKDIPINVNASSYACHLLYLAFISVGNTRAGILPLCFQSVLF